MQTCALDMPSVLRAMNALKEDWDITSWKGCSPPQDHACSFWSSYSARVQPLTGLAGLISVHYHQLNTFLHRHGLSEDKFKPFDGVGVASVVKRWPEWLMTGIVTPVFSGGRMFPGFELTAVETYTVPGFDNQPLAQLRTAAGDSMWVMIPPNVPSNPMHLALMAQKIAEAPRRQSHWSSLVMPMLDVSRSSDLSWLTGMIGLGPEIELVVQQAFQHFRVQVNHMGAEVLVGMEGLPRVGDTDFGQLIIDQPFIAYFTHKDHEEIATAALWAERDCWSEPASMGY